jgi:hypothetical protein
MIVLAAGDVATHWLLLILILVVAWVGASRRGGR